jgi:hypothetical protein
LTDGPTGTAEVLYGFTLIGILILQVIVLIGVLMASYIFNAVRFYKTMYSKQGYLTHTLPVNYHQLVLGKLLTNSAWNLIITIAVVTAEIIYLLCVINWAFSGVALAEGVSTPDIWSMVGDNWSVIVNQIQLEMGIDLWSFFCIMLVLIIIAAPFSMMTIFGAITIGQLSSKHKVAMSILCYFAINMVFSFLSNIISFVAMARIDYLATTDFGRFYTMLFIPMIVLYILATIGFYFISKVIVEKKLNLE